MSKYYVYSTLSQNVKYVNWTNPSTVAVPLQLRSVMIRGGANVMQKNLITPKGVVTEINDEDHAVLMGVKGDGSDGNRVFQKHKKAGFVTVEKKKSKVEKVVKDMSQKDESAQLTKGDFKEGDAKPKD